MRITTASIALLAALFMVTPAAPGAAQGKSAARVIEMTGTDNLRFTPDTIQAKPGERLKVVLKTQSALPKIAMAHNFVLLAAGTDAAAFANAAATASSTAYIPPAMKSSVLASTGLAGAGETVEVTFKAPTKPGQYDYICSFPGHFVAGMKGVLVVQ